MRNLIKKSLAFVLVAALALTCFVGTFSVSAEDATSYNANISVTANPVTLGATEATAVIDIDMVEENVGINEALINISSEIGAIKDVALTASDVAGEIDYGTGEDTVPADCKGFYLSANSVKVDGESVMGSIASATITVTFAVADTVKEAGSYAITIDIPESKVIAATKDEVAVNFIYDNSVSFVVEEAVVECTHENATKEVTTQPTKDAEGVMTYTCECGVSWTEAIAKPVATTAVTIQNDIVVSSVVGSNITVYTKPMRNTFGEDATYFISVEYQKYATGYVLEDKVKVLTPADRMENVSTANKDMIAFNDIALYEMTLDFNLIVYFVNGDGVVIAYTVVTTNIVEMALSYVSKASPALLTALADMCNYGASVQAHFASKNAGSDICDAVLPTTLFADYMTHASSTNGLPSAGQFNNDKGSTKLVSTTGFVSGGQTLVVGASNQISYIIRHDNYELADIEIKVHYEDSINGHMEFVLTSDDLVPNGTASNGQPKYLYYFKDLALYDADKTVTMDMYHNGVKELTSIYSIGNFVNNNLSGELAEPLTYMELFSNSAAIALNLPARW